jgi:hypothetical protein
MKNEEQGDEKMMHAPDGVHPLRYGERPLDSEAVVFVAALTRHTQ